jgi:hypothetical protein
LFLPLPPELPPRWQPPVLPLLPQLTLQMMPGLLPEMIRRKP